MIHFVALRRFTSSSHPTRPTFILHSNRQHPIFLSTFFLLHPPPPSPSPPSSSLSIPPPFNNHTMAPKNFTQRDMDLMAAAFQSLKTPPEVRTFLPVTSKDVIEANSSALRSTTTSSPRRQATRMQQLPASASWTPRRSCLPMTVTLVSSCGCAFLIFLASLFLCDADALSLDSWSIVPSQNALSYFVLCFLSILISHSITFPPPTHLHQTLFAFHHSSPTIDHTSSSLLPSSS